MMKNVLILMGLMAIIFLVAICFLTIPSLPGPTRAVELNIETLIASNSVSRTYGVTISNVQNSTISYPATALAADHHPILYLACQTNSVWKYTVEPDFSGLEMKLSPHGVLRCQIAIPNDVKKFKIGLVRIDLTWRGRLGLVYLDARNRAKIDWSPETELDAPIISTRGANER